MSELETKIWKIVGMERILNLGIGYDNLGSMFGDYKLIPVLQLTGQ